jgi:membrane protease YdiL (CAAX protease family)
VPTSSTPRGLSLAEGSLVALTSIASVGLRAMPRGARLPAGLSVAGAAIATARRHDASWSDLGLATGDVRSGMRWGVGAASVIAASIGVATRWPSVRERFADRKVASHSSARAAYEMIARIPIETALAEELLFRSAVLGIGLHRRSTATALLASSAMFGLWHIVPTWVDLSASAVGAAAGDVLVARIGAIAGVVAVTATAGVAFGGLRLRSRSVLAPVMAHAALNTTSFAVARSVGRAAPHHPPEEATR